MRWSPASANALHIKSPQPQRAFLLSGCSKIRNKYCVLKTVKEVKMKVLKFGGSSLADAERYLRVKDISLACHTETGAAVVLSAPKGVTNALSLLCDEAASGKDYGELFAKLNMVLFGM